MKLRPKSEADGITSFQTGTRSVRAPDCPTSPRSIVEEIVERAAAGEPVTRDDVAVLKASTCYGALGVFGVLSVLSVRDLSVCENFGAIGTNGAIGTAVKDADREPLTVGPFAF